MINKIAGRFSKLGETENSIIVGLIGCLTEENISYEDILKIAGFYGISTKHETLVIISSQKKGL